MRVSQEEFEHYVAQAMDELPDQFAELLENIVVQVEDEPSEEDLREVGMADTDDELLGLYRGVPLGDRDTFLSPLPDQVILYRGPLIRICRDRRELVGEIRDTLVHEIGHYFGLSDEDMPY